MESSARSGHLAAEAVCQSLGEPRTILEPDLKPRGLMRLIAGNREQGTGNRNSVAS
jgi:hypothetical protein